VRVVESGSSPTSSAYRDVSSSTSSAAVPLVLLARVWPLSSADTLRVTSAERRGAKIAVALEVRHDTGALLGNDFTLAFVEVALGTLPAGSYDAMVRRTTSTFSEPGHPELARDPVEDRDDLTFTVR